RPRQNLEEIEHDLRSADVEARGSAMRDLLQLVRKDPAIHSCALGLFRRAVESEDDGWTASSAVRGIEHIAGAAEARNAWLALLQRPSERLVMTAALSIEDPALVPALIELLRRRPE